MTTKYECPECGSNDLTVRVATFAKLHQSDTGCVAVGVHHEWDGNATMICRGCAHEGHAQDFVVRKPKTAQKKQVTLLAFLTKGGALSWYTHDPRIEGWKRVPAEDKIVEVKA